MRRRRPNTHDGAGGQCSVFVVPEMMLFLSVEVARVWYGYVIFGGDAEVKRRRVAHRTAVCRADCTGR